MKNYVIKYLIFLLFINCGTPSYKSLDRQSNKQLDGQWVITSVTYPGSDVIKTNSFQLADSQCFVGSQWQFISSNNKGNLSLNKNSCPVILSDFTWFVNKEGNLTLKVLDEKIKAKRIKSGYVLQMRNHTDQSFQWVESIDIGGKMTEIVYQFTKI